MPNYIPKCRNDNTPMEYDKIRYLWICPVCGSRRYIPIPKCIPCGRIPMQITEMRGNQEVWKCAKCGKEVSFKIDATRLHNLERGERRG